LILKHLKPKKEYKYKEPDLDTLDTFPNPGVGQVTLDCIEFTSLCPVTGQPDYYEVKVTYEPQDKCLESKSLKLYLGAYRQVGSFAEQLVQKIWEDICLVLKPKGLLVQVKSSPRGGIFIKVKKWQN